MKTVGASAFADNTLASLTLGAGVKTIGAQAFQNNQLTTVSIPTLWKPSAHPLLRTTHSLR